MLARSQGITISDPAFRVSRQVALACQENGILGTYFTSFFFGQDSRLHRIADALPAQFGRTIRSQLSKRSLAALDASKVETISMPELMGRTSLALKRKLGSHSRNLEVGRYRDHFDRQVAKRLCGDESAVYVNEASGLYTLRRAKELSLKTILEGVWHPDFGANVLEQEYDFFQMSQDRPVIDFERNRMEIELADVVFTQSDFSRKTFIESGYPADRVTAIPLGVDLTQFEWFPRQIGSKDSLNLIWAGGLSIRKGTGRLLQALIELDDPRITVDFVGGIDEHFLPIWNRLSPRLGNRIRRRPPVPRIELANLYREADALILPSLLDSFGQVIIEAMAVGTPVIVTSSCGAPVRHELDGLVIPPADNDALASAIQRMLDNPEERLNWSTNAAEQASIYSWQRFRTSMALFLQEQTN